MDSQKVISEAWRMTLKRKYLWVFGFIAGLTYGSEEVGVSLTQGGAWLFQNLEIVFSMQGGTTILVVVISVVLWLLGLIARISLIQDIVVGEQAEKILSKVTQSFRSAMPFLGVIIVMQILVWSPIIILSTLLAIWSRPLSESFRTSVQSGTPPDVTSFGIVWSLGMSVFLLTIPLLFIDAFSYRSMVVENLGVLDGIKKAFIIIRTNFKPILGLAFYCLLIGFAFSIAVGIALSPFLFIMFPMMQQVLLQCAGDDIESMTRCMQELQSEPLFVGISLLIGIISAAISSVWVTFQSLAFTIAYRKLA